VLVAALVAWMVRSPTAPAPSAVRGHRVFGVAKTSVRQIDVALGERRFTARRTDAGWELDGRPAGPGAAAALDDLLLGLVDLRAVDVFRPRDGSTFGLDVPRATITLHTARGTRRVAVGGANVAGSAFYARREGSPRVVQVGTLILSRIERVFFQRDRPPGPLTGGPRQSPAGSYRPEIG
jgi:hypothetical protein